MSEMYFSFCNDYQRQNPFTKKEGMHFYITELKKRGYISKFIYDILRKNIEKINVMEIYYDTCIKPNLTQTQTALARINNKFNNFSNFNMEDLKKSLKRAFKEREEKLKIKKGINKRVNSEIPKKSLFAKKEKEKVKELEKKKTETEKERKNKEMVEMIDEDGDKTIFEEDKKEKIESPNKGINIEIVNSINNISKDDNNSNNNDKTKRKNTEISNKEMQIDKIYDQESLDCSLSEAFTDKGSFIINQYKNPLLLNIGLGISNLAFMGKNDIKRAHAINREDEIEEPEDNEFSNILFEDKE
jgi:hypothetical protein